MATVLEQHIAARNEERRAALGNVHYAHYVEGVLADRADRYAAHVATMDLAPEIVQWSLAMRKQFGTSYVRCSHFVADWITALLIVRYGEEPDAALSTDPTFAGWPVAFSDQDVQRAADLLVFKKWPAFLTPLVSEA